MAQSICNARTEFISATVLGEVCAEEKSVSSYGRKNFVRVKGG